ncbi:hypothetical protein OS493_035139 [Desmophyllum pertusum]|uniref:DED domain-containing protein n=1 Tax=Desmophyllum pertusum TaxID=174260 RepID=A0A9W9YXQ3_9CNID|nr:hypothetical protein OS493_035139 [Desmophyllum pertusum]
MTTIRLNPFPILLNNLSNELEDKDLQNLKNVCAQFIPGGQREKVKDGWDVFNILQRQNVIGGEPEKIATLLSIIKELRRRDLDRMIKRHIQEHYEQPEMILKSVYTETASSEPKIAYSTRRIQSQQSEDEQRSSSPCCVVNCLCCKVGCYSNRCCTLICCCVGMAIVFAFFAAVAVLSWYADIPEVTHYLNSKDDLRKAGPYVTGALGFFALCCALCGICVVRRDSTYNNDTYSGNQDNVSIQATGGYTSTRTSASVSPVLTREGSFNTYTSNPITASCSLSSSVGASALPHPPPPRELAYSPIPQESNTVQDGLHKHVIVVQEDDNVKFFTPRSSRQSSATTMRNEEDGQEEF